MTASLSPAAPAAQLLDVQAVAAMLGCSPRTVYRLSDAARMPASVKLNALVRWRKSTGDPTTGIDDWVIAGCPRCDRRPAR